MMREGVPIGVFSVWRREVRPFTDKQIELFTTFADQGAIAIENVRLFTELGVRNRDLTEAVEQQTATSEVLKVISRSTFDLQPVLETVIESATRLCGGSNGFLFRLEGDVLRLAVARNASTSFAEFLRLHAVRPGRETVVGRTALERRVIHIPDVTADPDYAWGAARQVEAFRTVLGVPFLREGALLGVIVTHRNEVRPFTDRQIELVTTFADQGAPYSTGRLTWRKRLPPAASLCRMILAARNGFIRWRI